jgi:hypothetical protein
MIWSLPRVKRPLFEKSGAKTFGDAGAMGTVTDNAHGPALTKFFCFFLFTKRSLPFRANVTVRKYF